MELVTLGDLWTQFEGGEILYKRILKKSGLMLAVVIAVTMVVPTGSMADDSIIEVRREDIKEQVLDYSPMIKGMELDLIQLSQDYRDLKDQMKGLEAAYKQLGAYEGLYNLYQTLSANYTVYMNLMLGAQSEEDPAVAAAMVAQASAMIDGDSANEPDGNDVAVADELILQAEIGIMPIEQYVGYTMMATQFAMMGITNPNLSKAEEYNSFIYPIKIVPAMMQNGAMLLSVGIEQAAAGLGSGAEALYDATLLLEGYEEMQKMSYDMAVTTLYNATKKYELGQLSEIAYKQAQNDEKIALLNYESMQRDVENMKMNLNVFMGKPVTTTLALIAETGNTVVLEPLDSYIERGLKERAEIKNNNFNRSTKENEMDYIEKYLGKRNIDYIRGTNSLQDLTLTKAYDENLIKADIMKAYANVISMEELYRIKKLSLEDALRQQSDMQLNVELGFVTESMASGLDILVTQATNDYDKAYRDYLTAVSALELSSGIGQASMGGF